MLRPGVVLTSSIPDYHKFNAMKKRKTSEALSNLCRNSQVDNGKAPRTSVHFVSLKAEKLPADWGSHKGGGRAAAGTENLARQMGFIIVDVISSPSEVLKLMAKNPVDAEAGFSEDGEYQTPSGQIPVSRLVDMCYTEKIKIPDANTYKSLEYLLMLQNPASSKWKRPFIRVYSSHKYDLPSGKLTVQLDIFFGRLVFELIADPAIHHIINNIQGIPYTVQPVHCRPPQPEMYKSIPMSAEDRFSLSGLLRNTESSGYTLAASQPDGLSLQLYDFQSSTYQWMLDQENLPGGLNSYFWEKWEVNSNYINRSVSNYSALLLGDMIMIVTKSDWMQILLVL